MEQLRNVLRMQTILLFPVLTDIYTVFSFAFDWIVQWDSCPGVQGLAPLKLAILHNLEFGFCLHT